MEDGLGMGGGAWEGKVQSTCGSESEVLARRTHSFHAERGERIRENFIGV